MIRESGKNIFSKNLEKRFGENFKVIEYTKYLEPAKVYHTNCGNTYYILPGNLLKRGCPKCNHNIKSDSKKEYRRKTYFRKTFIKG